MVNLKIRLTSFLTGFAVAGGLAMYQVRQDVLKGTDFLAAQAQQVRTDLEQRITALEAIVAQQAAAAGSGSGTPVETEAVLMAVDTPQE